MIISGTYRCSFPTASARPGKIVCPHGGILDSMVPDYTRIPVFREGLRLSVREWRNLADALDLGSSGLTSMGVRVPPLAPKENAMIRQLSLAVAVLFVIAALASPGWAQYAQNPYYPYQYYYNPYQYPNAYAQPQRRPPARKPRRFQRFQLAPSPAVVERYQRYQQNAEFRNRIRSPNNPETEVEYMLRSFW